MNNFSILRDWLSKLPADASNDAHGAYQPKPEEMYTPDRHAQALMPETPIVAGARGAGKSYWSGVLLDKDCLKVAEQVYPQAQLGRVRAQVGFSGQKGRVGVDKDKLDAAVPNDSKTDAKNFWWATILRAIALDRGEDHAAPEMWLPHVVTGKYESMLDDADRQHERAGTVLLIVFDAIDTIATNWPRRRMLTQALLEVVWAMRAWRHLRPKLFIRRDQLEDDDMQFVELPKLRAGAVNLEWHPFDLYGLLFTRIYLGDAAINFHNILEPRSDLDDIRKILRESNWPLRSNETAQRAVMIKLAGPFMASGLHGKKKGTTYDWPIRHLEDANKEITPRAFLTLLVAAAGSVHQPEFVLPPTGIRLNGLRAASTFRVDQLHSEYLWIKGALAPLSGILLPAKESVIYDAWRDARTLAVITQDAMARGYLAPFAKEPSESELADAMCRIGVMQRRAPGKIDMPDLFRVAAKLLKKGATTPM